MLRIIGVNIFLEKRKTRMHVGILDIQQNKFVFAYDESYFRSKNIIPLGPEFPLTEKRFTSEALFPSFEDRIPSKQNPAYDEYCYTMGIAPSEKNPLVLLSTIGRKGPSSFIFYPIYERELKSEQVIAFRKSLGLTTREFSAIFELSQTSLNALERKKIAGNEILKRLEILIHFPEVALYYLQMNGGSIMPQKFTQAYNVLQDNKINKQ